MTAVERASRWLDAPIARCITFLANSWLLYEPTRAADVFGGLEAVHTLVLSNTVESLILRGVSALFQRDPAAVETLRKAAVIAPGDPYIAFLYMFASHHLGAPPEEQLRARSGFQAHAQHPLHDAALGG